MRSMIMEDQQKKLCWEYDARRGLNRYPFAREDFGLSRFKGAHDSVVDWDAHEKGHLVASHPDVRDAPGMSAMPPITTNRCVATKRRDVPILLQKSEIAR